MSSDMSAFRTTNDKFLFNGNERKWALGNND